MTDDLLPSDAQIIPSQRALLRHVEAGTPGRIQTVNLQHLQLAQSNESFSRALWTADYVTADGWPVVALMRRRGRKVFRATGSQLVADLVASTSPFKLAVYGGSHDTGDRLADRLRRSGHDLVVRDHGRANDWDAAVEADRCRRANVSLILVAVSQPRGEIYASELRKHAEDMQIIGVGGAIDMLVGQQHRAPTIVQRLQLEWLFRLASDPKRLSRRYLVEGLPFFFRRLLPALLRPR